MKSLNKEVSGLKESVFSTITQLAIKNDAINLAQGFPDFDGPDWILELAGRAVLNHKNQYAHSYGILPLREQISRLYQELYDLSYNAAANEVLVTHGATEAIYATIRAILNPGDEVVVFEPMYDSYAASVQMAQGVLKPVTLHQPDFTFKPEELLKQVSEKTKLLILNNPHNPTGRVFTLAELQLIADLAKKYDFYVLSDEVYEHLTFTQKHIPMATLPGMQDCVITISSIGKTLSLTGWKVGWACGPAKIIQAVHNAHQFINFCGTHPIQAAVAEALTKLTDYLPEFKSSYAEKKNILNSGLKKLGFDVLEPQGTYFSIARLKPTENDWTYAQDLTRLKKVAAIPLSPFYIESTEGNHLIRFCFAKKEQTLLKALTNLQELS